MDHDAFIGRAVDTVAQADRLLLARTWLHSLDTRDHSLRGAWGSLALLTHLEPHAFEPSTLFHPSGCAVCGLGTEVEPVSEERLADAGHRYLVATVDWAAADVAGAAARIEAASVPSEISTDRLREALQAVADLPAGAQLTELNGALAGHLASNKYERMRVLEQLGVAGILPASDHPGYSTAWVRWEDANSRQPPERNKREWAYPVRFWTGSDGVDWDAVDHHFG